MERVYVSREKVYQGLPGYYHDWDVAHGDLDSAVSCNNKEVEVGIYQLVRVARFKKTAVEQVTLTEVKETK